MDQDDVMDAENQQESAELNQNLPAAGNQILPNGQSSSSIFKLNEKCFGKLFDYLSIEEVHSFSQTCKAFQKVAGEYFQRKYPAFRVSDDAENIPEFIQFVKFLDFYGRNEDFVSNCKALKHAKMLWYVATQPFIDLLKPILPNLESFVMDEFEIDGDGDVYENILKHCVQLKSLKIYNFHEECLSQKYPVLEHIQFERSEPFENDELNKFFKLNPTVRHFSTNAYTFWTIRRSMLESRIKLDDLTISPMAVGKEEHLSLLNELHKRRFYKRLHLTVRGRSCEGSQLASLSGLVTLHVSKESVDSIGSIRLPPLTNLKEFGCDHDLSKLRSEGFNVHEIPALCTNLERLAIHQVSVHDIMPFIRYSVNLREIEVKKFHETVLDIVSMNAQREKLAGARKVMIYVTEDVYLATRWTSVEVNLSLIEIQRLDSHEPKRTHDLRCHIFY